MKNFDEKLKATFGCEGVEEIPEEFKIFTQKHIEYTDALVGNILLNDVKGQILNIIEGIGLSNSKQEIAVKRMITNVLHEGKHHIRECLDLVEAE